MSEQWIIGMNELWGQMTAVEITWTACYSVTASKDVACTLNALIEAVVPVGTESSQQVIFAY